MIGVFFFVLSIHMSLKKQLIDLENLQMFKVFQKTLKLRTVSYIGSTVVIIHPTFMITVPVLPVD